MGNESTPYDGHHPLLDDGNDWQKGNDPTHIVERFLSYGNYAGPGDNSPAAPIDGMDAAAQRHDDAYGRDLGANGYFSWQGIENTHADDARLVSDVNQEMAENGGKYSPEATQYSEGLRGFFGGRVAGGDAVDWAGAKLDQAGAGISSFADEAAGWSSLGDAGHGIATGISDAASFVGNAAGEAWHGVADTASTAAGLGWPGMAATAIGLGNVAVSGVGHLAGEAWDWLTGG